MSGPGPKVRMPPPLLGEHTTDIVDGLGLGPKYEELQTAGAFSE